MDREGSAERFEGRRRRRKPFWRWSKVAREARVDVPEDRTTEVTLAEAAVTEADRGPKAEEE